MASISIDDWWGSPRPRCRVEIERAGDTMHLALDPHNTDKTGFKFIYGQDLPPCEIEMSWEEGEEVIRVFHAWKGSRASTKMPRIVPIP